MVLTVVSGTTFVLVIVLTFVAVVHELRTSQEVEHEVLNDVCKEVSRLVVSPVVITVGIRVTEASSAFTA